MGIQIAAGTEVSGTGASTVRIPSADRVDSILVASTSAGSLKKTCSQCHHIQGANTETNVWNI